MSTIRDVSRYPYRDVDMPRKPCPDGGDRDWVGMIACPICGKDYALLLDRRLRKSLCRVNVDPREVCDECRKEYLDDKGVMFINPTTGELYVVSDKWYNENVNIPMPPKRICFMRDDMTEWFRRQKQLMEELKS